MITMKGAAVSAKLKEQVEKGLETLTWVPKLTIIRVGENPDDISYEKGATKKLTSFGLEVESKVFPGDISDEAFKREFAAINADASVDGILMLRPLPKQINEQDIEKMIDPAKDLDGISPVNIAKVFSGDTSGFAPCTAEAVVCMLKMNDIALSGKRVAVVGRSMVVGRPLSMLLLHENATVTICHSRTANLPEVCREADILTACVGKAAMINHTYVKKDAVVIDVGINVDENGKLCGDVDFADLEGTASAATPVPGGVGGVTTAVLAQHLVRAARMKQEKIVINKRKKVKRKAIHFLSFSGITIVRMTVYQQLFRKVRTHCGVEFTDETEKREEFFMRKMGMMRNRMAFLLAAGTMTMTSAAGLAGCTSAPASVTVQSAENTGITVTSQEKIKAEPDIAEITYSVYSQAADASTCQSENQTDLDAVLALLKEKGIADTSVQTSGLGLNPIYDWDNGKKITGYEMTTEVVVSDVAIEDAGAIISDSVNAGINSIDSVQYQCSNFDEIYQEALKKAIESARVKAEAMAEAGGCKLGTMTNVQEYSSGQQARYYDTSYSSGMAMKEMAMEDAGAGRNLMPGQVDVEAEVSATFSIQ